MIKLKSPGFTTGDQIKLWKKNKNPEFYLLRQKHLSEADLFITDYIKTKQRVVSLENEVEMIKLRLNNKDLKIIDE